MDNQAQIPDLAHLQQLAEAATQGEWQVIETELPCRIGRPHVERRIFTVKDHPQLKGPYPIVNGSVALGTDESPVHHMVSIAATDAEFIAAANPAAVLALISEIQALRKEADRYRWLRDKSESGHSFYLSVPLWLSGIRFRKEDVDAGIDTAMGNGEPS